MTIKITPPLTETAYADRLWYAPSSGIVSSDGLFTISGSYLKRIKQMKTRDAAATLVTINYKDKP